MEISRSLKRVIIIELMVPIALLTIGIYHGLMQTVYRSGVLHRAVTLKLDYYQGLTLHGVINAVVLTTFFAVAFSHAIITFYLKKEPNRINTLASMWLMIIGTLMAAWAMLSGNASVLYTFYPPLKAHPMFYLGAALLIVGSWLPLFDWTTMYVRWKREHEHEKTPLAVIGTLINFTIWFVCTTCCSLRSFSVVASLVVRMDANSGCNFSANTVLVFWTCTGVLLAAARIYYDLYHAA